MTKRLLLTALIVIVSALFMGAGVRFDGDSLVIYETDGPYMATIISSELGYGMHLRENGTLTNPVFMRPSGMHRYLRGHSYVELSQGKGLYMVFISDNKGFAAFDAMYFPSSDKRIINYGHSAIIEKAKELRGKTDYQTMLNIYSWVADNMVYVDKGDGYRRASEALETKSGICSDYSFLFAALCIANGLDAVVCTGDTSDGGKHAWNEVVIGSSKFYVDCTWHTLSRRQDPSLTKVGEIDR